jgi:hypothetical protein
MLRKIATATVLACGAMLTGCAADTTALDTSDHGPTTAEQTGPAGSETVETLASMDVGEETTGKVQEDLTQWQKVCTLGCVAFSNGGCAAVSTSCVAGALWSFGGILIPCSYAVVAACVGAGMAGTVCAIKCGGG